MSTQLVEYVDGSRSYLMRATDNGLTVLVAVDDLDVLLEPSTDLAVRLLAQQAIDGIRSCSIADEGPRVE